MSIRRVTQKELDEYEEKKDKTLTTEFPKLLPSNAIRVLNMLAPEQEYNNRKNISDE